MKFNELGEKLYLVISCFVFFKVEKVSFTLKVRQLKQKHFSENMKLIQTQTNKNRKLFIGI